MKEMLLKQTNNYDNIYSYISTIFHTQYSIYMSLNNKTNLKNNNKLH